jgi:glutathione S-transferase
VDASALEAAIRRKMGGMITVHGFPMSPNTRRVLVALEEAGAPYEVAPVDLMAGAHRGDAYRKLNPTSRVPTIVVSAADVGGTKDFVLWESNAVLSWLGERYSDKLWAGKTAEERADVLRWMFMNAAHLSPAVARIFAHTIRLPEEKRDPQIVEESRSEVARSLVPLEQRLTDNEFIAKQFGIADISLSLTLAAAPMLGISFGDAPHVATWLARVEARPAWKKVHG